VVDDGYQDQAVEKLGAHTPAGPLRGGKYSAFDAGTRVLFLLRWPARVKPGVSGALLGQIDLVASLAALAGQTLEPGAAPDSQNVLPAFLGSTRQGREWLVEQPERSRSSGPAGSTSSRAGGPRSRAAPESSSENSPEPQLYDLDVDLGERQNLAAEHPKQVEALAALLKQVRGAWAPARAPAGR